MIILIIDDDRDALVPLRDEIGEHRPTDTVLLVGFEAAESTIASRAPDLIVLDVFSGPPSDGADTGCEKLERIWNRHFRPIVIYSADPTVISEPEYRDHPFIRLIEKGSGSELRVRQAIGEFSPLVDALHDARQRIEREFSMALRDVSPHGSASGQLLRIVERAARRRVAALVDETDLEAGPIEPWEQYVFPPVSDDLRQGDVIRIRGVQEAEHHRIVLTPSCDLVAGGDRSPKVDKVLVARCVSMTRAMVAIGIGGGRKRKESRVRRLLNSGFEGHVVPLPALPGRIPMMAADLRSLELVPFDDVCKRYDIVASIDSPFREAIAWAYMQTGARPGLPERAIEAWAAKAASSGGSDD